MSLEKLRCFYAIIAGSKRKTDLVIKVSPCWPVFSSLISEPSQWD